MGEQLPEQDEGNSLLCIALHNIHGATLEHGFAVSPEIEAIKELGVTLFACASVKSTLRTRLFLSG